MAETYLVEPDVGFIKEVAGLGGGDLKKCFQCATCSVACPISPETRPFPRKEMIAASWGLKERVIGSADIWLCHNCGDCTSLCPRGAKPGDVLAALRSYAISEYAVPRALGKMVNDPKKLPLLIAIPVVLFLLVGLATGLLNLNPQTEDLAHWKFFSTWLVDMFFVPLSILVPVSFALSLKRFINDIHQNALKEGKTTKQELESGAFIQALIRVIPTILLHNKFNECGENKDRGTAHLLVLYSFIALFIVTAIAFISLYGLGNHGPFSQVNPVKWLANIGGVALCVGAFLLLKSRLDNKETQPSSYVDWYLVVLVLAVGVTGLGAEVTRLLGLAFVTYWTYFVHLVCVFMLIAFLPFSKLAHLVYRTVAMAYVEYAGRK